LLFAPRWLAKSHEDDREFLFEQRNGSDDKNHALFSLVTNRHSKSELRVGDLLKWKPSAAKTASVIIGEVTGFVVADESLMDFDVRICIIVISNNIGFND
jgi:hypothetical protein